MYFGSVRFFKQLFLVLLAILFLAPCAAAVALAFQKSTLQTELMQAQTLLFELGKPELPEAVAPPTFAYQTLYPELYVTPPEASVRKEGAVYLTFDDGPSQITPKILETLRSYDVKATFFVVGRNLELPENREILRDAAAAGHTIGIHTYSHVYANIYTSVETYLEDFNRVFQQVYEITGTYPNVFRFPGGSINGYSRPLYQALIAELQRRGFVYFDWNVSSEDAVGAATPEKILRNSLAGIDDAYRAVILLHDSSTKATTAEALPALLRALQERDLTLEALTADVAPVIFTYEN